MRERDLRVDPLDAPAFERQRPEERRDDADRVYGRAHVAPEAGRRQLKRARAAADGLLRFEHADREPTPRKLYPSAQAVRPRADHDRVVTFLAHINLETK